MENFQNDCCRSWTKKPFDNSYSRQLRIVNAVVCCLCWSPEGQIDRRKSVFLQDKVTLFETMMTTMNEANRDKTKVPDFFFFVMFRLSVLLLNSMSKLIHNRCTCKLVKNSTATCMQTEQLRFFFLCFNPLFFVAQLWHYTKTVICLRLSEYCRIIPSTSSRGLFDNIHWAWGQ